MDDKRYGIVLGIVIAIAFAMRVFMARANMPFAYWHDENSYIEMALKLGSGKIGLLSMSHGGLYQIALLTAYAAYYVIARMFGTVTSPEDIYIGYLQDPTVFFLIARGITIVCGLGAIYLIYLIASKCYDRTVGLLAAIFAAFSLVMVQTSSLAFADTPAVFMMMLAVLFIVYGIQRPAHAGSYYMACLFVGLSAACKYYAIFGAATVYLTAFLIAKDPKDRVKRLAGLVIYGTVVMVIGFIAGMPFFLFNLPKFFNDTFVRMGGEYIVNNPNRSAWLYHFTNHLRNGLGLPLELACLAGVVYAAYRRTRSDLLMLAFPVTYYLLIMNSIGFAYHLLPAIPFLVIMAAALIAHIVRKFFSRGAFAACLAVGSLLVAPSAIDSIKYVAIVASPDTRTEAKAWIETNIPEGSSILSEGYIYTLAVHGPVLTPTRTTLERDIAAIAAQGGAGTSARTELVNYGRIYGASRAYDLFKRDRLSPDDPRLINADYIVMSGSKDIETGAELAYYLEKDYYKNRDAVKIIVSDEYRLIRSFIPTDAFTPMFPHLMDNDYRLIRSVPISKSKEYLRGPRIDVFKIKQKSR